PRLGLSRREARRMGKRRRRLRYLRLRCVLPHDHARTQRALHRVLHKLRRILREAAMAHPYHHALASVKKWGGDVSDYLPLHTWFDHSKAIAGDFRHRALRHHAEGIFMLETIFGVTITLSTGRVIPTRWVGEQHVKDDLGFIPSFADWMRAIR